MHAGRCSLRLQFLSRHLAGHLLCAAAAPEREAQANHQDKYHDGDGDRNEEIVFTHREVAGLRGVHENGLTKGVLVGGI